MLHPAAHGRLDEGARFHRVVEVVAERIDNRIRHHDRAGKMDDRLDAVLADEAEHELGVADIALDQLRLGSDRPAEPGGKVVEDDDRMAIIGQSPRHVAADIAAAAGHQNRHGADNREGALPSPPLPARSMR